MSQEDPHSKAEKGEVRERFVAIILVQRLQACP
jgi:hypothetical protein